MSTELGHDLDVTVHQLLFGQADTKFVPRYSTNFTACLLVDERLLALGWRHVSTTREGSLTTVTLQHTSGRQVVGHGIDQYEAICKAAISPEVIQVGKPNP